MTMKYSGSDLKDIIDATEGLYPNFDEFPCPTPAVERSVKFITEASQEVCGKISRDGYIRAKLQGREDFQYLTIKANTLNFN